MKNLYYQVASVTFDQENVSLSAFYKSNAKTTQRLVYELVNALNLCRSGKVIVERDGVTKTFVYRHCGLTLIEVHS